MLPRINLAESEKIVYHGAHPEEKERCIRMKTVMIRLSLVENVNRFVNIVGRYPYDMDLRAGRHVVDAKSILGIFSLDLSKPITLSVPEEFDGKDFLSQIKNLIVTE